MKDENEAENIRVAVRCRPMNERELREQAVSCFIAQDGNAVLTNLENPSERHEFGFDYVYGIDSAQTQVFSDIGLPILDKAFGGYNGTIFAYGQTGSGKTFSMNGVRGHDELEGLIPRMNRAIFERIAREKVENPQKLFLVECSFFEIYNEVIFDLLDSSGNSKKNKAGLEIKEHAVLGIYVKDLQERVVESRDEVVDLMQQGQNARTVGYTQMNAESSRSHSIFIIKIHQKDATDESKNIFAKINLVDLAGSERAASTGAQGDRLKEGANINKSLSALGNVINALVEASRSGKKVFIPYRNSKLTRVLQESLGGNSLCSMLATLSPANINFVETLSTLKYASRAKAIKVNAKKNEASSQISQLNEEIAALKKKLTEQTSSTLGLDPKEKDEIVKKYEQQIKEMDRVRMQTWEDKAKLSKQHELERKRLAKEKALADQRTREERTRKWKLLEEKGDVELMLRALRDLDRTSLNQPSAGGSTSGTCTEDKWLVKAQAMKMLETEAKDHRTMIMVFKDAVDKDVDQWSKRLVRHESTTSAAAKRDDTAATHMIVNQLCSKLQNVFDESKQLMQMEKKLVEDGCELINEMMSELIKFKEKRKVSKTGAAKPPTTSGGAAALQSKEEDQVREEREKGLSMTLALIQRQRAKLVTTIRTERQKMFNLAKVSSQFIKYMDSYTVALASVHDGNVADVSVSLDKWKCTNESLAKAAAAWDSELPKTKKLEENASAAADSIPVTYVPKGEVAALGLESKLIGDDCLYASSRKTDAKLMRMNSPQFWLRDEQDTVPFLVVDLEFPRFVQSVAIRGGNTAGSPPIATTESDPTQKVTSSTPITTFQLQPPEELKAIVKKYNLDEISGESEQIYEILGHVMSWSDLLKVKSTVFPAKLFSRPPVRFLHDIISVVTHNTGYAKDLFSATERDYANLNTKTERIDYLTKILDFVQEGYRAQGGDHQSVVIAATASNILAGKEPIDTLKFIGYFAIAAMQWGITHPPAKISRPRSAAGSKDETHLTNLADVATESTQAEHTGGDLQTLSGRSGWVKKMRISTSLTGKQWRVLGDFDANSDDATLQMITFPPGLNAVGRFVQFTCIDWHEIPLFQVEIYGQEASESDELVKSMDTMGSKASEMIQQLLCSAALFAEEARASWEKAKDAEREKQEELIKLMAEITRLKQSNAQFEKEIKEIQQSKTTLQQSVKTEAKKYADEKAKNEKLHTELQQAAASTAELKKEKESLGVKLNEHAHSIQKITLQMSEQKKEIESLVKSKTDLEDLSNNLRNQLQSKNANEGHQESKLASVMSDLMAVNVQLDEIRRRYETSEQMRKEQEAASQHLHAQLQTQLSDLSQKEGAAQKQLHGKISATEHALEVVQSEKHELRRRLDESIATATASTAVSDTLRVEIGTLQYELETWKLKAAEAQERASPTSAAIEAASASTNSQENEQLLLELQTKELRYLAELEKAELKLQANEQRQREIEARLAGVEAERDTLARRTTELGEQEEELQFQLQIVTEERDAARVKEEQLFMESNEKDQEIERIRDGYVWVTDRMNMKEDELAELQEQLEKYQALVQITTPSKKDDYAAEAKYVAKLYSLATGKVDKSTTRVDELVHELCQWIEHAKKQLETPSARATAESSVKLDAITSAKTEITSKREPGSTKITGLVSVMTTAPEISPEATINSKTPPSNGSINRNAASNQDTTKPAPLAMLGPEKADPVASQSIETGKVPLPTIKTPPEVNQAAANEPIKPPPKQPEETSKPTKPSPRESAPLAKLDPKPELDMLAPTKPATPRRETTPPTSARRLSSSSLLNAPSNQMTPRSDDAYDDDFDADEPETEAKRQLRRKQSGKA